MNPQVDVGGSETRETFCAWCNKDDVNVARRAELLS